MSEGMRPRINLRALEQDPAQLADLCVLLNLGMVQALLGGALTVREAIQQFYHAENCILVRDRLRNYPEVDTLMSRGVQLGDLFRVLSAETAQHEVFKELEAMRSKCLSILQAPSPKGLPNRR